MDLAVDTWGHGPRTVMLLHGFAGSRQSWWHLKPYWSEDFRVVAVELPGHGASPSAKSFEEAVRELARLVEKGTILVGYSQGARMALAVALRCQPLIKALVLESGTPGLESESERVERLILDDERAFSLERVGVDAFMKDWEKLPIFAGLQKLNPEVQQALARRRRHHTPFGLSSALRTYGLAHQPNYWPQLPQLQLPTLLLVGSYDTKFLEVAQRMQQVLPSSRLSVAPEIGHTPHLEATEWYANEVLQFVKEVDPK